MSKSVFRVTAVLGLVALTACSANTEYSILNREATPSDALPASIVNSDAEIVFSTSRFVGVDNGVSLWLAAPAGTDGICLVVYPDEQDWSVGCGGSGLEVDMRSTTRFAVYPDGLPDKEGTRRISENVFVLTG